MGYPSADDVDRLSEAMATKSAIEEVEYRQNHGSARSSGGSGGAKFLGSVPIKTTGGSWFAKKAIGSGYNLTISPDTPNGSLVEYQHENTSFYGKIVKNDAKEVVVSEISETEAKKMKEEGKVQVVKLSKRNASRTESKNLVVKILNMVGSFLFPSEDDGVDAFLITFVRLIAVVAFVMVAAFLVASAL